MAWHGRPVVGTLVVVQLSVIWVPGVTELGVAVKDVIAGVVLVCVHWSTDSLNDRTVTDPSAGLIAMAARPGVLLSGTRAPPPVLPSMLMQTWPWAQLVMFWAWTTPGSSARDAQAARAAVNRFMSPGSIRMRVAE